MLFAKVGTVSARGLPSWAQWSLVLASTKLWARIACFPPGVEPAALASFRAEVKVRGHLFLAIPRAGPASLGGATPQQEVDLGGRHLPRIQKDRAGATSSIQAEHHPLSASAWPTRFGPRNIPRPPGTNRVIPCAKRSAVLPSPRKDRPPANTRADPRPRCVFKVRRGFPSSL